MRFSAAATADRLLPEQIAARTRPLFDRLDAILLQGGDRGEATRTSLVAFAIRIVSAVIAFVSQVLLARWMGGFEYGIFVLVWTTMLIVGNLSCLGFHTSIVRYIPEYRAKGQLAELRGIMAASKGFVLVTSTLFALLGIAGVWAFSEAIESYYVVPFYLGIVCLPMMAVSDVLEGTARANSWAITALSPIYLMRPILILAFMVAALAAGYAPSAETAIVAAILATLATTVFQALTIMPRTAREVADTPLRLHGREWIVVSLPIFLVEGFFFMLTNADVLMVGYFLPPTDVAIYFATVKTLALVHFVYFAVKAGVAQRYAHYAHGSDRGKLGAFARETAAWTFWPSLAMGAIVLLLGKPILMLFGPGFDAAYPVLFVLVAGVVARASVGPAESLLTMSGNQNICAAIYGVTLAINVVLNLLLIPPLGLWGAAISTAFAIACEAAMLSFVVWRRLGIVMLVFIPISQAARVS
ncbi:lipopolysaccharide biosynthesis protein [Aquamicrobium sp. LC103]|uniref:lipopolysaccharide biosynthesis protein n=1 Tax=Aquamicrobium sp. LC103 TaxID=1120658 RepID=UPI00063E8DBA|nr:lipopolysaccharide biosynthesis protein [Aquamicrobium sp. LC103]TKT75495.1 lipopolysaccharide biosynthesis protein [Aquamicrobium sp. LC103]